MTKDAATADAILEVGMSTCEVAQDHMSAANVVDGLYAISRSIRELASSLDRLGVNNADTPMGALELLSLEVRNGATAIVQAIEQAGE